MKKYSIKDLVLISLLVALNIVLSRFLSISAWNIKIGFTFITVFVSAYLYGPIVSGIVNAVADLIGSLVFPIGAYFPGFTITAFLVGIVSGLILYKNISNKRIVIVSLIYELIFSLLINTYWISILYETSFIVLMSARLIQSVVMIIVEIVSMKVISKILPHLIIK